MSNGVDEYFTQENTFVEGDTAFTFAQVGFLMVPEVCSFGTAEGLEPCERLGGFLIGFPCSDDEPGGMAAFVVCAEHLGHDLVKLAEMVMKNKQAEAELLASAWSIRQQFHDHEVERLENPLYEVAITFDDDETFSELWEREGCDECGEWKDDCVCQPAEVLTWFNIGSGNPDKQYYVECDCGHFTVHKTENQAERSAKKHVKDGHATLASHV